MGIDFYLCITIVLELHGRSPVVHLSVCNII